MVVAGIIFPRPQHRHPSPQPTRATPTPHPAPNAHPQPIRLAARQLQPRHKRRVHVPINRGARGLGGQACKADVCDLRGGGVDLRGGKGGWGAGGWGGQGGTLLVKERRRGERSPKRPHSPAAAARRDKVHRVLSVKFMTNSPQNRPRHPPCP